MKNLEMFTNVDKARLLHQLFPSEMPALIDFIQGMCEAIKGNEQANREQWDNGFKDFNYWFSLLQEVETKIKKYGKRLDQSATLFADQLFDGMLAVYTNHCIYVYSQTRKQANRKFGVAIDLLFNP